MPLSLKDFAAAAPERLALLFGAEGPGLSAEAMAAADVRVQIPMDRGVRLAQHRYGCGHRVLRGALTRRTPPRASPVATCCRPTQPWSRRLAVRAELPEPAGAAAAMPHSPSLPAEARYLVAVKAPQALAIDATSFSEGVDHVRASRFSCWAACFGCIACRCQSQKGGPGRRGRPPNCSSILARGIRRFAGRRVECGRRSGQGWFLLARGCRAGMRPGWLEVSIVITVARPRSRRRRSGRASTLVRRSWRR